MKTKAVRDWTGREVIVIPVSGQVASRNYHRRGIVVDCAKRYRQSMYLVKLETRNSELRRKLVWVPGITLICRTPRNEQFFKSKLRGDDNARANN